jgi:hypothetical protein
VSKKALYAVVLESLASPVPPLPEELAVGDGVAVTEAVGLEEGEGVGNAAVFTKVWPTGSMEVIANFCKLLG